MNSQKIQLVNKISLGVLLKVKMLITKLSIQFFLKMMKVDLKAATVHSRETWWYRRVDLKERKERGPPRRVELKMEYELVRHEGRWLINRIRVRE